MDLFCSSERIVDVVSHGTVLIGTPTPYPRSHNIVGPTKTFRAFSIFGVVQVNLVTSFNIVKAGVKAMIKEEGHLQHSSGSESSSSPHRRGGGSIVLVSAALASHGIPNYEAMSAAKAAVEGEPGLQ